MITFITLFAVALAVSDPNCASAYCSHCPVGEPTLCASCIEHYVLRGETCVYKGFIHCLQTVSGICMQCEEGYEWDPVHNECVVGENGCHILSEDGISCMECKRGWMQNDDYTCTQCPHNPNCKEFDGSCEKCIDCGNAYGLVNGICNQTVEHCSLYMENNCLDCALGYYLYKQECKRGPIENCRKYELDELTQTYQCRQCIETFVYDEISKTCLLESDHKIEGCDKLFNKTHCLYCKKNYHMTSDMICKPCPEGCIDCNVYDTCEECAEGYVLENGVCTETTLKPYQCNPLAQSKEACAANHPNCVFETVNEKNYCTYKGLNCTTHDANYKCTECIPGYVLDKDNLAACVSSIEGCSKYAAVTVDGKQEYKCVSCDSNGYFIQEDFTCGKCGDMCVDNTCEHSANTCVTYRCDDFACGKCSSSKDKCDLCQHNVPVGSDGWCGPDTCADYLETGECNYCAHYSLEQEYDVALKMNVPKNYYFYVPDEKGHCGAFIPPVDPDKPVPPEEEKSESNTSSVDTELIMYICIGVVGLIIVAILVVALIWLIVYLVKKRMNKNSEYHILD